MHGRRWGDWRSIGLQGSQTGVKSRNIWKEGKRLAEIAKPEAPLDAVSFLRQLPVWGLCVKELSLLAREWRYSPAKGSTGFASKSFGHVACPSCQPSPALRLANCESDVAVSANPLKAL